MSKQCLDCKRRIVDPGWDYCPECAEAILKEDDAAIEAAYAAGAERDASDDLCDYNPESDPKKYRQGEEE